MNTIFHALTIGSALFVTCLIWISALELLRKAIRATVGTALLVKVIRAGKQKLKEDELAKPQGAKDE